MKKLLLFSFLFMVAAYAQSAFVPQADVKYNIKQLNSGLVIGASGTTPVLQAINQQVDQAFSFIPVEGKPDTYLLKNEAGKYLNKQTANSGDWWSIAFENAVMTTNSEWVISEDPAGSRLMLVVNSKYLATDQITAGAGIYCDKALDNANGVWLFEEATVVYALFKITEKDQLLEVEKDYRSYPIHVTIAGIPENFYVTVPNGFSTDITKITPEDVLAADGNIKVKVSSTADAGTAGFLFFWIGTDADHVKYDSVSIKSVDKYKRFYIQNNGDTTMTIGNHSSGTAPALTAITGLISQKFFFRPVNPGVNDSLFYIVQDGDYRMMIKDPTSNYATLFGTPSEEAKWKIDPQADGVTSAIYNYSIISRVNCALGPDGLTVDSRLYDDKTFVAAPTSPPYCEWRIVDEAVADVPKIFKVLESDGILQVEKNYQSYPINITTSGITKDIIATVSTGFTIDKSTFTPDEFTNASGKLKARVSTSAPIGTNGTILFSYGTGANEVFVDTVSVTSIEKATRYFIESKMSAGLVIGNDTTAVAPALTTNEGLISQKFIIRPVNPTLTDSLFYIIQDGDYQMMKKSPANGYDVIFGAESPEAVWKINTLIADSAYSVLTNVMTAKEVGTDGITVNDRLWDDKTYADSVVGWPYCRWRLVEIPNAIKKIEASSIFATVSGQQVNIHGTTAGDKVKVYTIFGQLVKQLTAQSSITSLDLNSGVYLVRVNAKTLKVVR